MQLVRAVFYLDRRSHSTQASALIPACLLTSFKVSLTCYTGLLSAFEQQSEMLVSACIQKYIKAIMTLQVENPAFKTHKYQLGGVVIMRLALWKSLQSLAGNLPAGVLFTIPGTYALANSMISQWANANDNKPSWAGQVRMQSTQVSFVEYLHSGRRPETYQEMLCL